MDFDIEAVIRLLFASVLGAIVGIEREAADQPAGLRTHIAVSLGAALFGVISTLGFQEHVTARADSNINVDVTRVASQVVVAIGFLGAGMIFRQGTVVKNLTSGASLWATAAVGLACGVGDEGTAAMATAILIVGLVLLRPLRDWIRGRWTTEHRVFRIALTPDADPAAIVETLRGIAGIRVDRAAVEKHDGRPVVVAGLSARPPIDLDGAIIEIVMRDDVVSCGERDTDA